MYCGVPHLSLTRIVPDPSEDLLYGVGLVAEVVRVVRDVIPVLRVQSLQLPQQGRARAGQVGG